MLLHSPNILSLLSPWHIVESSSGVSQPQPEPRPVFNAASTSCLQEGRAPFLWCSLSLGVLEWTGPLQAQRLEKNPPRSLRNWFHPLPPVSCPWTVECVVSCRLLPESCGYTLFSGPAVCCMVGAKLCLDIHVHFEPKCNQAQTIWVNKLVNIIPNGTELFQMSPAWSSLEIPISVMPSWAPKPHFFPSLSQA